MEKTVGLVLAQLSFPLQFNYWCPIMGGFQIIRRIRVFQLFCNQNQEKHGKRYSKIQSKLNFYSSSLRQYTFKFLPQNSKYKPRKTSFHWPLLLVNLSLDSWCSDRTTLPDTVLLWAYSIHCGIDMVHYNPIPNHLDNSPLVNQKFTVNMTDEERLLFSSAVEIRWTCRTIWHFSWMSDNKCKSAGPNVQQKI